MFDAVYTEGNKVWQGSPESGWLGRAMRKMAENLLHLAFRSATLSRDKRFTAPSISVDRVRRTFQIATVSECSSLEDPTPKRGDMTFALGNICWKVYDQLQTYRLLDTISQMYSTIRPSPQARLDAPCTSRAEVVGYWFWCGKLRLAKGDLREARDCLKTAFDMCPVSAAKNLKAIFIRLLTCQILLGFFPAPILLNHFNLHAQFGPLLQAIKWGDRARYYQHFNKWSEWFRQRGLWLVLREKGEVLVWRSLFRNAYRIHRESHPEDPTARSKSCPTSVFLAAMRLSFRQCGETNVDITDVISILASLIDQSYIKGHLGYMQTMLVMRNAPDMPVESAFPRVSGVRPRRVTAVG